MAVVGLAALVLGFTIQALGYALSLAVEPPDEKSITSALVAVALATLAVTRDRGRREDHAPPPAALPLHRYRTSRRRRRRTGGRAHGADTRDGRARDRSRTREIRVRRGLRAESVRR